MIATRAFRPLAAVLAIVWSSASPAFAEPMAAPLSASCDVPLALSAIEGPLNRTSSRILSGNSLTIVAMGSSSTLGIGASNPASAYPSRLEQELRERFPGVDIRVINHGVGGQDVPEELTRLERDVTAEHPDLVIWQVGTNAVLRRDDRSSDEQLIARGVALLQQEGVDVVLMDLQYAPRVLARPAWTEMERLIKAIARHAHVGLFRRFEIMEAWDHTHQLAPAEMIGADGLHMTDVSYGCLANQLADALASNWRARGKLAESPNRNPASIAQFDSSAGARPSGMVGKLCYDRRHWRLGSASNRIQPATLDNRVWVAGRLLEISTALRRNAAGKTGVAALRSTARPQGRVSDADDNLHFYWVFV